MRIVAGSNKRLAVFFAISLAVFSTGLVIAHQCHSVSSNQVTMQHNHSDHSSAPTSATKSLNFSSNTDRLIDSGCAALFIVVLLLGKKLFDLGAPNSSINRLISLSRDYVTAYRPQVFHLALSRPQLGVIRI
jgi:hypothetical protein